MYCINCGNALEQRDNFCQQCGTQVAAVPATAPPPLPGPAGAAADKPATQKFWARLGRAVLWELQRQAIADSIRQQQSGDNFWYGATARGNDNGQSGYVDVGGTIVGYDK
jgi:zinc-ribbon domain